MTRKSALLLLTVLGFGLLLIAACSTPEAGPPDAESAEQVADVEAELPPPEADADEPGPEPAAAATEPAETAVDQSPAGLPPADLVNDEGGPVRLVGESDYTDFSIQLVMSDPSPALLDMVHVIEGNSTSFAPLESQILGYMTSPVVPAPLAYAFNLPEQPTATFVDVDNDGEADQGVQVFAAVVASNINGGSYLEQLDQAADLKSYLTDPVAGTLQSGTLLVYAADDRQGFPTGFGEDGILFTADDPVAGLPQGYTVVRFGPDGFSFDRSREAEVNMLEKPSAVSSDYSKQGILESFNSLIDELAARYSFTELRGLDWEQIRVTYLPDVQQIDQIAADNYDQALGVYAVLLSRMAQTLRDAHVAAGMEDTSSAAFQVYGAALLAPVATNLGANTTQVDDGRIIVTDIVTASPADEAGWTFGTEIVSVDGIPVAERLPASYYYTTVGTEEGQRLQQVANLLKFPSTTEQVVVETIPQNGTEIQSHTMTPGAFGLPDRLEPFNKPGSMPIEFTISPEVGYARWSNFHAPDVRMAVWEEFLREVKMKPELNGIILDLRGNGGGWDNLYFTMASYFFNEDAPVSMHWIDQDVYDEASGGLVREAPPSFLLSSPDPELYYGGPLVVLVDNNCASSCEFFTQFLQRNGRAQVIAQYGTKGAGAPINRVTLPGSALFQYTKGRAYFAGTDELNLEAKGVTPDVRVPTTLEGELAKLQGTDIVLQAAIEALQSSP